MWKCAELSPCWWFKVQAGQGADGRQKPCEFVGSCICANNVWKGGGVQGGVQGGFILFKPSVCQTISHVPEDFLDEGRSSCNKFNSNTTLCSLKIRPYKIWNCGKNEKGRFGDGLDWMFPQSRSWTESSDNDDGSSEWRYFSRQRSILNMSWRVMEELPMKKKKTKTKD